MKVYWASSAEQDRADIVEYIAQDNPSAAIQAIARKLLCLRDLLGDHLAFNYVSIACTITFAFKGCDVEPHVRSDKVLLYTLPVGVHRAKLVLCANIALSCCQLVPT